MKVRLQGAEELNRVVKNMKDVSVLMPQMRLFLNFLDSMLEEQVRRSRYSYFIVLMTVVPNRSVHFQNFKMNLLTLEIYGVLAERMKSRCKPHLRTLCNSLLRHASHPKIVVRIENYRAVKKLMLAARPNAVLAHMFDHVGDKRSLVRESILNIVMYALLTFPSNEFDLKAIAASVVPTLVDPKRRVRQGSQECVAILAAYMGPTKAAPLIRYETFKLFRQGEKTHKKAKSYYPNPKC